MKPTFLWYLGLAFSVVVASRSIAQQTSPQASQPDSASDQSLPPLKRVVFYNSGVAHMQHAGKVTGNAKLEIRFSSHDVDDVLKSLVFEDRGGGYVRAVEYKPAPNPEDVAANDFEPMTLAQLLQKYRGETVAAHFDDETKVTGSIFGLESRTFADQKAEVLVLLNEAGMQSIRLNDLAHVQFESEAVRKELKLAMTGVAKSRKTNQKKLDLLFSGEGEREVGFAYVVDAPIWRMTYRLAVLPDDVLLQGWTHINNVTGVDWDNVVVELRSGQPQTFHAELFAPVLAERRSVGLDPFGLPSELMLVRQWYGFEPPKRFAADSQGFFRRSANDGVGGGMMGGMGGGMGGGGGYGGGYGGYGGGGFADPNPSRSNGIDSSTAFRELAKLDRTSQMVRFQLTDPVNLASGKSAALPVFSKRLPNRLLSVVKHDSASDLTAIRAVELTNKTEFALVPGPVNVTRDGDFVGDGRLDRVAVGALTLLPYAVDRPVSVTRQVTENKASLTEVALDGTRVKLHYQHNYQVHFDIDNQDAEARLLQIDYQAKKLDDRDNEGEDPYSDTSSSSQQGPSLTITPAPLKRVGELLTYEVPVNALAQKRHSFTFSWQTTRQTSLRMVSMEPYKRWLTGEAKMTGVTRAKLESLLELDAEEKSHQKIIKTLLAQKRAYTTEQSRVRENLQVLGSGTTSAEPFLKRLNEMETGIREIEAKLVEAEKTAATIETRRKDLIGD